MCLSALNAAHSMAPAAQHQCRVIRDKFVDYFVAMRISQKSAAYVHYETLRYFKSTWMQLRSNQTCFSCSMRNPEHTLSCGHTICDTCVQIFARPVLEGEYHFILEQCLLCSLGTLRVTLKPPTAGTRILSIDGGGVRGVVPLEFLSILQDAIGPECQLQDLFDLAFGTSSGKCFRLKGFQY